MQITPRKAVNLLAAHDVSIVPIMASPSEFQFRNAPAGCGNYRE
jgi:hypothetical protein